MNSSNILICGLPSSGKTSFIAALWYLLNEEEQETTLKLVKLPNNRVYLNSLSADWCRCKEVQRTKISEVQEIAMHLRMASTGEELELHAPDMDGERWRELWSTRSCAENAANWSSTASGIILFIHAEKIRQPIPIDICDDVAEADKGGSMETENVKSDDVQSAAEAPVEETEWDAEESPTQVMLIDILQSLSSPPLASGGRPLSIVVSAWDKAEATGLTPEAWLKAYLPMLHQYLLSSGSYPVHKIYGVSALGGDLAEPEELKGLEEIDAPSLRIKVVEGSATHPDLTAPLRWLMSAC